MAMENGPQLEMHFLLKMEMFHCYLNLPEGKSSKNIAEKYLKGLAVVAVSCGRLSQFIDLTSAKVGLKDSWFLTFPETNIAGIF